MGKFLKGYPNRIKLIVTDLDGCLTGDEKGQIDVKGLAELHLWNKRAREDASVPAITLISGRPMGYVEAFSRFIGSFVPSIFENGCGMYRPDRPLGHEYDFHPELTADPGIEESIKRLNDYLYTRLTPLGCGTIMGKKYAISLTPCRDGSVEDLLGLVTELPEDHLRNFYITRSISVVDITPLGINKGLGFDWLLRTLQDEYLPAITAANVLGIGDSWGDLPFLKKCGVSAAPGNAAEAIKDAVGFVFTSREVSAVLEAVAAAVAHNKGLKPKSEKSSRERPEK